MNNPTRINITDLPQEVLDLIVYHVGYRNHPYHKPRQEFYNLCLVKPFHQAALEQLYHTCTDGNIFKLLRTLILNPRLAALVRELFISSSNTPVWDSIMLSSNPLVRHSFISSSDLRDNPCITKLIPLREDERQIFVQKINLLDLPRWRLSISTQGNGSDFYLGCLNALLLLHVPNVKELTVGKCDCKWRPSKALSTCGHFEQRMLEYWEFVLLDGPQKIISQRPEFRNLDQINLLSADYLNGQQISQLFRIKSLKTLLFKSGEVSGRCCEMDQDTLLPQKFSNITWLDIFGKLGGLQSLATWVRACKALDSFSLMVYATDQSQGAPPLPFDLYHDDLLNAKTTLKHLELRRCDRKSTSTPMEHLRCFQSLESLALEPCILYKVGLYPKIHTLLPPSITDLTILYLFWREYFSAFLDRDGPLSGLIGGCPTLPNFCYIAYDEEDFIRFEQPREEEFKNWNPRGSIFADLSVTYEGSEWIREWCD